MSEDVIRCSKCGGTLSGDTCTACGATGQAIKCEHCGSLCPADARWCPSCGRHLSPAQEGSAPRDPVVPGGGNLTRLLLLFALIIAACVLIYLLTPEPESLGFGALLALFLLAPGSLHCRLVRSVPLVSCSLAAASIIRLAMGIHGPFPSFVPSRTTLETSGRVQSVNRALKIQVPGPYEPGTVLARFKDNQLNTDRVSLDLRQASIDAIKLYGSNEGPDPNKPMVYQEEIDPATHDVTIHFDAGLPVDAAVQALKADPHVVFAEPDYIYHALYQPDDQYLEEPYETSRFGPLNQWYPKKIQAAGGWEILRNVKSDTRLAIIDTGIDYTHPDLAETMARDSKGKLIGRNFFSSKYSPKDDNAHGTHCAGIAAAQTDNKVGIAGIGFNSFKLVPAKVLSRNGSGSIGGIKNAIIWCADNGCRVESLSLGGPFYSQALQDAINYAWSKGTIVVAATGNEAKSDPGYPAGCNHVVAVSATDENDQLASFSNYGMAVSVGAPGVKILATMPTYPCELTKKYGLKENYDALNGTSMACPVVSGMMAALLAYQPSLTPTEAIQRIEQTADNTSGASEGGWEIRFGHGRVNLANAILWWPRKASVGSFYGQVTDRYGAPLREAAVRCEGRAVTTRENGMFRLANLRPGSHPIEISRNGKTEAVTASIVSGADTNVTVVLK